MTYVVLGITEEVSVLVTVERASGLTLLEGACWMQKVGKGVAI